MNTEGPKPLTYNEDIHLFLPSPIDFTQKLKISPSCNKVDAK